MKKFDFEKFDINDSSAIERICNRMKKEKIIPFLSFINEAFEELQVEIEKLHHCYFFTSNVLFGPKEIPGYLYVNMDGFYTDCLGEDKKIFLSWDYLNDMNIHEENNEIVIDFSTETPFKIKEVNSKNLKILYTFYKNIRELALNRNDNGDPRINWNWVLDTDIETPMFSTVEEYILWGKGELLEMAIDVHNANQNGFDGKTINDSNSSDKSNSLIKCTFEYRPTSIYLHTCDDKNDIEDGNYELIGESDYNGTGTNIYDIKVNDKSILKFEVPVDYIEEEDLDLSELEGRILIREISYWSKQYVTAFLQDGYDYLPGSSYYGLAFNFNGVAFGVDAEDLVDELEEYVPRERETQEVYFEYYQIVDGKPILFELDE